MVTVDGAAFESAVTSGPDRVIEVNNVPVTSAITVEIGTQPSLAPVSVGDRLFALLDSAQISFASKERIDAIANADQPLPVRVSQLQTLGLDRALETAVGEILLARP